MALPEEFCLLKLYLEARLVCIHGCGNTLVEESVELGLLRGGRA
ncbi:MAG TPA: hypothetical protein VGN29_13665 [Solirubrobacteraceae bacterium]|nr:hypothetical protein [Solirubrobacteraceae bacterium]